MGWVECAGFSVLRTPNGSACITSWANPGYCHGVILYADGRVEEIPPTDHFASQKHMHGLPGVARKHAPFESSRQAAQAYAEWRLAPEPGGRQTAWDRINRE